MCIFIYVCVYVYMSGGICVYTLCTCVCTCVCMYMCVCVNVYGCMYRQEMYQNYEIFLPITLHGFGKSSPCFPLPYVW